MGRPPIGDVAMTGAERVRRWREHHAQPKPPVRAGVAEVEQLRRENAELRAALAERENRPEAELAPLTASEMRQTMLKRYELALKRARIEIREELRQEVWDALQVSVSHYKERIEEADRIMASHRGVMSKKTFRTMKACLHPDANTFEHAAEMFMAFGKLEGVLVKPEPVVREGVPPMPSTVEELMARRRRRAGK